MAKRKKSSSNLGYNVLKYTAWFLAIVVIILGSLVGGYYFGYQDAKNELTTKELANKEKRLVLLKKLEENTPKSVSSRLKSVLEKETKKTAKLTPPQAVKVPKKAEVKKKRELPKIAKNTSASHEYETDTLAKPPSRIKRDVVKRTSNKPRLAIIIDDVSVKSHIKAIKSLGLPLTMSFLPPSKFRPSSAKLAANESFYMVHLPMEAQNFNAEEPMTLRINDSQSKISSRILEIKKLFPKVEYINNHTGSKFTSNERAMNRLILAFKRNNINFIDSRTTSKTMVPKVMKNYGLKYVGRDIFLDHHTDKAYVKKQIIKAIKIAKAEGTAIAIGHPHKNTLMALKESKSLFKDIDLVYINKIY